MTRSMCFELGLRIYCSYADTGESLYLTANVLVFIFLAGKSNAPSLAGGGGTVLVCAFTYLAYAPPM